MTLGSKYHDALAREICSFIAPTIQKAGGVMSLHDVYCRYNRARTNQLVSPDDLKRAAKRMAPLGLSITAHKFDSGVYVLKSSMLGDEAVCNSIMEMLQQGKSEISVYHRLCEPVPVIVVGGYLIMFKFY